ncbi:MAG: DUF2520 domain-containing protein [Pyrinomonadaceae bacterium]|nr:DUF2520 domain-containing protein [Pyrinomonadaceae bacterium]
MLTVTIIGPGRVGGAFAIALPSSEFLIERFVISDGGKLPDVLRGSFSTTPSIEVSRVGGIASDIVLITVSDGLIGPVAVQVRERLERPAVVLHTSGALTSEVLAPLVDRGCNVGSMHPLVSISSPELGPDRMSGAYFCIEGDPSAVTAARNIVQSVGGIPFTIDTSKKVLYHASAVIACGHLVALFDLAADLMSKAVGDREMATAILLPLVESTLANLRGQSAASALTGTFARADKGTFGAHLDALKRLGDQNAVDIYLDLGLRSLELAVIAGADPEKAAEIRRQIFLAKEKSGC